MINEFIKGSPKAQPRPRAAAFGGRARVYNPTTAKAWKESIKANLYAYHGLLIDYPVRLDLLFYMPRPKSHYGSSKGQPYLKSREVYHRSKPDVDNMVKAVMDAISDCEIWTDDNLVVTLKSSKIYEFEGQEAGCRVKIQRAELN